ncbi:hypothetical protein V1508DRAFT_406131 [Lipomyces doorenjongii]|uniref:uncharacterized protein n=1 Tax=Lipomyces doorenjongii TaxID=383834 RepID=UPI0034D00069
MAHLRAARRGDRSKWSPLRFWSLFEIESLDELRKQEDPDNPLTIYRDGQRSCNIGNRTIWFFCDTLGYNDGTSKAMTDNSLSHRAVQFFNLRKYNSIWSASDLGNTTVTLEFDPDTEMLTVTRDQQVTFPPTTYAYGSFASIVGNGVAFLYGLDTTYSNKMDVHVARVSFNHISDYKKYQYYDASTKSWSFTQPLPTARRPSAAVTSNWMPYSTGSMFYSEYHSAYLLVVSYAPFPVGPWTAKLVAPLFVPGHPVHVYESSETSVQVM